MTAQNRKLMNEVNTELAKRGAWLVKVPKYLSEIWEANEGNVVGKLKVGEQVKFHLQKELNQPNSKNINKPSSLTNIPEHSDIPTEYSFVLNEVKHQKMSILSEDKTGLGSEASVQTGKLAIEGRIVKEAACIPEATPEYFKMVQARMIKKEASGRRAIIIPLPKKKLATHEKEKNRLKKTNLVEKTIRLDRDTLRLSIFQAFEQHSFYRLTDLRKITQQPIKYLQDILTDIAVYHKTAPYKNMWSLKPEYCNYSYQQL